MCFPRNHYHKSRMLQYLTFIRHHRMQQLRLLRFVVLHQFLILNFEFLIPLQGKVVLPIRVFLPIELILQFGSGDSFSLHPSQCLFVGHLSGHTHSLQLAVLKALLFLSLQAHPTNQSAVHAQVFFLEGFVVLHFLKSDQDLLLGVITFVELVNFRICNLILHAGNVPQLLSDVLLK